MSNATIFARLGLFVVREFLDAETCVRLRSEARSAPSTLATVQEQGARYSVDESVRSTRRAEVSASSTASVEARLLALQPKLESHFGLPLGGRQPVQFLVYKVGDFYRPHRDNNREADAAEFARQRRISVVVFLNGQAEAPAPGCYGGGALRFYGLMRDGRGKTLGFPLTGEPGLLVAFPSEQVHEVAPVTWGERFTVVTWYF
jgi:SM-20-related protein